VIFPLLIGFFTQSYGQVATAFVGLFGVIVGALIAAGSKLLMSAYERHHQLRMAALEKRVQAHQEAFALWAKLCNSLRKPEFDEVYKECQDWWYGNCIYLEDEVRKAFRDTYLDARGFNSLADTGVASDVLREYFARIESLGNMILRAISLPPIRELETELSSLVSPFQEKSKAEK
jgi:hypothetical protein